MQASGVEDEAEAEGLLPEFSERACCSQMRKPEKLLGEKGGALCVFGEINVFIIYFIFSFFSFLPFAHDSRVRLWSNQSSTLLTFLTPF